MGRANNMRYMINVTASTPYRYATLTMIAFPENATAPSTASVMPRRLAVGDIWGGAERVLMALAFYGTRKRAFVRDANIIESADRR